MRRTGPALEMLVRPDSLTIGIELPLESDTILGCKVVLGSNSPDIIADFKAHANLARMVDRLGFAALWLRDSPVHDRIEASETESAFDVFAYLGFLSAITDHVVLGTAAMVLPIRHPLMVAKAAASVDVLSGGRLVLGVALGDHPIEHSLLGSRFDRRYQAFRETVHYVREVWEPGGIPLGDGDREPTLDILPRPLRGSIPMIIAGRSQMDEEWVSRHMDGRMVQLGPLRSVEAAPRERRDGSALLTSFYLDLAGDPDEVASPIRLGVRAGRRSLVEYLRSLSRAGTHHVALNMSRSRRPIREVLEELSEHVLPQFQPQRVLIPIQ